MIDEKKQKDNVYELFSVVVHCSRITGAGHYYAYINTKFEQWYRFNDTSVEKATREMVYEDNFGGKFRRGKIDQNFKFKEVDSEDDNSAYMLVYVKRSVSR